MLVTLTTSKFHPLSSSMVGTIRTSTNPVTTHGCMTVEEGVAMTVAIREGEGMPITGSNSTSVGTSNRAVPMTTERTGSTRQTGTEIKTHDKKDSSYNQHS